MEYILGEKESGCVFCNRNEADADRANLILWRGSKNFVIMNKYPYNNGHLMIVPNRHTALFHSLDDDEMLEMMTLTSKCLNALKQAMNPDGFNIGMNVGRVAGAGIDDHLHLHIVPRWDADTNFMPVLGHTKIVSEGLLETWDKLIPFFGQT